MDENSAGSPATKVVEYVANLARSRAFESTRASRPVTTGCAVLVLRVWRESEATCGLRARITQMVDVMQRERRVAVGGRRRRRRSRSQGAWIDGFARRSGYYRVPRWRDGAERLMQVSGCWSTAACSNP